MPAQTARTPGNGSGTLTYTLSSDSFDVESVYVSVDATAAASAVTAELTIKDQSGVVIARKKQTATIAAGSTGSATWALRLDDDGTSTASGLDVKFDTSPQVGTFLEVTTTANTYFTAHKFTIDTTGGTEIILASGTDITATAGTFMDLEAATGWKVRPGNGDAEFFLTAGNALYVYDHLGNTILRVNEAGTIVMPTLPVLDPGVSGTLWNSGGFVAVSP